MAGATTLLLLLSARLPAPAAAPPVLSPVLSPVLPPWCPLVPLLHGIEGLPRRRMQGGTLHVTAWALVAGKGFPLS